MKFTLLFSLCLILTSCSSFWGSRHLASRDQRIFALMSPHQGQEAFSEIYDLIRNAEKDVNITIYSWSDHELTETLHEVLDKENPPKVRVVMKKEVFKKQKEDVEALERKGAMFKKAKIDLHEKFVLVDSARLVNSSANFSNSARRKYSEDFIYFNAEGAEKKSITHSILRDFQHEFAVLWNSAYDYVTEGELYKADQLAFLKETNIATEGKDITLYSSSMNYKLGKPRKRDRENGASISLTRIPNKRNQIWTVKDIIIKTIKEAKKTIHLNINHFNLREISDELIKAVKRGVDVKLVVDNQEYKSRPNGKEMSPQFARDYRKLKGRNAKIPIRVKFNSFYPHYRYWLLNHHKYLLVDYQTEDVVLVAGSYNFSKTAEHSKFDNQVVYKGTKYQSLYEAFYDEFLNLWGQQRTKDDKVKEENYAYLLTPQHDKLPLSIPWAIALSWEEVGKLKKELVKKYPVAREFPAYRECAYYHLKKKIYLDKSGKECEPE